MFGSATGFLLLLGVLSLLAAESESGPRANEAGAGGGTIVFSSKHGRNFDLYVMNADGTRKRRLTRDPAVDRFPSFSPDGSKIAFISDRDGNYEVYVMNADGSAQRRRTHTAAPNVGPTFSPDGSKIAYTADARDRDRTDVYVMDVDGTGARRVTRDHSGGFSPSFSKDGSRIAFSRPRSPRLNQIYTVNVDGTG